MIKIFLNKFPRWISASLNSFHQWLSVGVHLIRAIPMALLIWDSGSQTVRPCGEKTKKYKKEEGVEKTLPRSYVGD